MAPFLKCWGDAASAKGKPYSTVTYECGTQDYIYVRDGHWAAMVNYRHVVIRSHSLNPFQLYTLYSSQFAQEYHRTGQVPEQFTPYRCDASIVDAGGAPLKVALCLRGIAEFEGLYDFFLKTALLGQGDVGVESALSVTNVSFENAQRIAERYIGAVSWRQ